MADAIPSDAAAFLRELISRLQRGTLARPKRIPTDALHWQPHRESNSIGVTERTAFILRIRQLAIAVAKRYVDRSTDDSPTGIIHLPQIAPRGGGEAVS